jgi:hypothetical protein
MLDPVLSRALGTWESGGSLGVRVSRALTPRFGAKLSVVNATIQFSNSAEPSTSLGVTAVHTSTLTGPALNGVATLSGEGTASSVNVTAGIFWRF